MTKYLIFTNIYKTQNKTYYQNQNKFKTFYAATKEEAKKIVEEIKKNGYAVTAIKTAFGNRVAL